MANEVATKQPCPRAECGSSDAFVIYDSGWGHCFSCGKNMKVNEEGEVTETKKSSKKLGLLAVDEIRPLSKRSVRQATCEKFGYGYGTYHGEPVQIAPYHDEKGKVVAQKLRFSDKRFVVTGDITNAALFGQHLWKRGGGKRIVVTEGEIDALSVAQVLGLTWPVVSVPQGAPSAKTFIKKNLEFLETYDLVVLMFDNDEPGQKAASECVELFSPGKCAVAALPLKDANEMLQAGREKELMTAVWEAQIKRPDGILNGKDLWDSINRKIEYGLAYPWAGLNEVLYGLRPSEVVTWCAGSGIGKSAFVREIAFNTAMKHKQNVGYVALEEGTARTALGFMGIHVNKPIHLPGHDITEAQRKRAYEDTLGTGRFWLYDHFGSLAADNLMSKLRYLVKGCGCKYLVLDHLSIVVSGLDVDEDERRALDRTMTLIRSFAQEGGCNVQLVSHLKRPEGRGHEEGRRPELAHLRGTQAIAQLSDAVIGASRDQQSGDDTIRNTTMLYVLKNRYSGVTGPACAVRYDHATGRLNEVPFHIDEEGEIVFDAAGIPKKTGRHAAPDDDLPF